MTEAPIALPAGQATRMFAADQRGDEVIVHDPLTGLTHRAPSTVDFGRVQLDSAAVSTWPTTHPCDVQGNSPVSLCWSPLVRCNLACPQCLDDKSVPELPRDQHVRIAGVLAKAHLLGVDISGGEPLLLRNLVELIDVLTTGRSAISVTTNGTHLARRAEALVGHVDAVRVSLDGPDALQHDRWRGLGSFGRAIHGIRAAVAYGIPTQIQTVLMRSTTRDGLQPMVDLAAALGVHGVTFLQMLPIGDGAKLADAEQLSDDEAREFLAKLTTTSGVAVRLRTREAAGGFTVVRADGKVWRNHPGAETITTLRPLRHVDDLLLAGQDGSA